MTDAEHLAAKEQHDEAHSPAGLVACVGCDNCGFTYAAMHKVEVGYICPVCAEERLNRELAAAQAETERLRGIFSQMDALLEIMGMLPHINHKDVKRDVLVLRGCVRRAAREVKLWPAPVRVGGIHIAGTAPHCESDERLGGDPHDG